MSGVELENTYACKVNEVVDLPLTPTDPSLRTLSAAVISVAVPSFISAATSMRAIAFVHLNSDFAAAIGVLCQLCDG